MKTNKPLRLCLDGRRADKGGIGRVTQETRAALTGLEGVELTVLCPPAATASEARGVRQIPCDFGALSLEEHERLPGVVAATGCDIFISPQFYAPPNLPIPVVSWVHDTWPLLHPEWLPPLTSVFHKFGENSRSAGALVVAEYVRRRSAGELFPANAFLAGADARVSDPLHRFVIAMFALNLDRSVRLITCSETSREDITRLFPEVGDRTQVVYNPVPRFALAPVDGAGGEREPALLHVSKWEPRKNIPALVRAFRRVAEAHPALVLRLVGSPTSEASREAVAEAIAASGLDGRVQIFENVSDEELARLYSTSRGFVMPSLYEGFSIPLAEAFAFGLPVAASRRAAIPEVAADAALYFDPEDEGDMARAIEAVLFDEAGRRRLAENSRRRLAELSAMPFRRSIIDAFAGALRREEAA